MINEFLKNKQFADKYLELLVSRLTSASVRFETTNDEARASNAMIYQSNMEAIKYLFNLDIDRIRPDVLHEVAYMINDGFYSKGFRKISISVAGSNVPRTSPRDIYYHIYSLIDNYENVWTYLDPYLREALGHIKFLRIHPYEDGNGRTARIITSYNLMKSGLAPAIITPELKKEYNDCIEYDNPEKLADMLKELSESETSVVRQLYEKYFPDDFAKKFKPSH